MASDGNRTIVKWQVDDFRPHPRQGHLFAAPTPHEIAELAADMQQNGQLSPVEILPNGTIIAGHNRIAAARLLGWKEVSVWVRHDLAGNPVAAERRLIVDNLTRRQLGAMGRAR